MLDFLVGQGQELDPLNGATRRERCNQLGRRSAGFGALGADAERRHGVEVVGEVLNDCERVGVCPVQILEDEQQGPIARYQAQQPQETLHQSYPGAGLD